MKLVGISHEAKTFNFPTFRSIFLVPKRISKIFTIILIWRTSEIKPKNDNLRPRHVIVDSGIVFDVFYGRARWESSRRAKTSPGKQHGTEEDEDNFNVFQFLNSLLLFFSLTHFAVFFPRLGIGIKCINGGEKNDVIKLRECLICLHKSHRRRSCAAPT